MSMLNWRCLTNSLDNETKANKRMPLPSRLFHIILEK